MTDRFRDPIVLRVPLEFVEPGPAGRLVEVTDLDLSTRRALPPLDLESLDVVVNDGLTPSETDPRSHQQMVYAVTMQVFETFERALGRPILWADGRRLLLIPHAFEGENALFDASSFSLQFGYFSAAKSAAGSLSGQTVYSCLSYDVVAHQATHPVLTQLRQYEAVDDPSAEGFDSDFFSLHEGYADLTALLVRLSEESVVARSIQTYGLDLTKSPELFSLGSQFAAAAGLGPAIRRYPTEPDAPGDADPTEPHARGAVLCSAFVDGLIRYSHERVADLVRLYENATADGWVHPDLVSRVANETSMASRELLSAALAAFDYLPPVDICFGDVLRAFVTVDRARFGIRHSQLRARIIEAFDRRKLAPRDIDSLAEEALVLPPADLPRTATWRLPHATDVLLLTVHSLEFRRRVMSAKSVADTDRAELDREIAQREKKWTPAIRKFARGHARRLGLEPGRAIVVTGLDASFSPLADGAVRGRVVVQLTQRATARQRARGVTLITDADGIVQHLIRRSGRRRRPAPWPYETLTPTQRRHARRLGSQIPGAEQ